MERSSVRTRRQDGAATVTQSSTADSIAAEIRETCRSATADLPVPGVAIGLLLGGETVSFGEGVTNLDAPQPITYSTAFQAGSITKVVTATALMKLVETGRVTLDTQVAQILPELHLPDPTVEPRVTLRDLLSHRTGWDGDLYEQHGRGDDALARVMARIRDLEVLVPFRRLVSYNNSNFYVLGRVLEVLTGTTYEEAVQALVLAPAGMVRSAFFLDELIPCPIAVGHMAGAHGVAPARPWMSNRSWNPTGGLITTAEDLLALAATHLEGGAIGLRSARQMREPQASVPTSASDVCLPWWRDSSRSIAAFSHAGDTFTSQSVLTLVPSKQSALVVLTNSNFGFQLIDRVRRRFLELCTGESERRFPTIDDKPAALQEFAGHYSTRADSYRVEANDSRLVVTFKLNPGVWPSFDPPGDELDPLALRPLGEDRFEVEEGFLAGKQGAFCRGDKGEVRWLHFLGRAAKKRGNL